MAEAQFWADTTARITGQIVDQDGTGFKPTTLLMTIFDVEKHTAGSAALIAEDVDVIADCDANGNVSIDLTRAQMVMKDATKDSERRAVRFVWTYTATADRGVRLFFFVLLKEDIPTT